MSLGISRRRSQFSNCHMMRFDTRLFRPLSVVIITMVYESQEGGFILLVSVFRNIFLDSTIKEMFG